MARGHAKNKMARKRAHTEAQAYIDLCRCADCGMSNPVLVEQERPKQCEWCGGVLETLQTVSLKDVTPEKVATEQDEDLVDTAVCRSTRARARRKCRNARRLAGVALPNENTGRGGLGENRNVHR